PLGAALLVWLFPWDPFTAGAIALLAAFGEVGRWIECLFRFNFDKGGLQLDQRTSWLSPLRVPYHVGTYGFSLWLPRWTRWRRGRGWGWSARCGGGGEAGGGTSG